MGIKEETRVGIVQALWSYIRLHDLQDKVDRKVIRADAQLRGVRYEWFSVERVPYSLILRSLEQTPFISPKSPNESTAS